MGESAKAYHEVIFDREKVMRVDNKTIKNAGCALFLMSTQWAYADLNSLVSGEISRTISQEVNKNIADKVIEDATVELVEVDKQLNAKADIKQAQQLLKDLGFRPGVVDGLMGKNTRTAINAFQNSLGIKQDGLLTASLLHKLKTIKSNK